MKCKKALLAAVCLVTALYMGGCAGNTAKTSSTGTDSVTSQTSQGEANNKSATDPQSGLTVAEFVDKMGQSVTMSKVQYKNAEVVGALDGKGFLVNGYTYEVFLYDDEEKLNEAKTGKMIMFGGSINMDAKVNGHFVLLSLQDKSEDAVFQAFANVK